MATPEAHAPRRRSYKRQVEQAIGNATVGYAMCVHASRLVQRDQGFLQELDVLLLQRNGEAVDDGPQDFQQLCDAVVPGPTNIRAPSFTPSPSLFNPCWLPARLVDVPEEDLRDDFPDGRPVRHELAVHPVQHGLHIVPAETVVRKG